MRPDRFSARYLQVGFQAHQRGGDDPNGDRWWFAEWQLSGQRASEADVELEPLMPFPVSEQRIVEAEQALGRTLPQELRMRLMRNNGGEVIVETGDWALHPVWDPTDRKTMGRTTSHVLAETSEARSWAFFPPDGVSLASDGSGDRLILCGNSDQVFLWEHETGECVPVGTDWL